MRRVSRVVACACAGVVAALMFTAPEQAMSASGSPCGGRFDRGAYTDFNHDGLADLAVAAPAATVAGQPGAGAVVIAFGKPGLAPFEGPKMVVRLAEPHARDHFGSSIAVGDLDGYCRADLVIGIPGLD